MTHHNRIGIGIVLLFQLLLVGAADCQIFGEKEDKKKWSWPSISVTRSGPYIGWQRGQYNFLEFGLEGQYKKVKLIKPVTHAAHMGFQYNFFKNVLGYDVGYWQKRGRLDLTFGANFVYRTDFTYSRVGIAPVVGYKVWQIHLQTGVQLLTPSEMDFPINILFISGRLVLIKNRDIKIRTD